MERGAGECLLSCLVLANARRVLAPGLASVEIAVQAIACVVFAQLAYHDVHLPRTVHVTNSSEVVLSVPLFALFRVSLETFLSCAGASVDTARPLQEIVFSNIASPAFGPRMLAQDIFCALVRGI
jgi:hypothetical protein